LNDTGSTNEKPQKTKTKQIKIHQNEENQSTEVHLRQYGHVFATGIE
jgi:hypothetical protein